MKNSFFFFYLRIWCPASSIWVDVNIRHPPLLAYDSDEPGRIPVITSIKSQPTMTAPDKACNSNLHYIACDDNDPKDQSHNQFYFGYINAQSVREKSDEIKEYIINKTLTHCLSQKRVSDLTIQNIEVT